MNAPSTVALTRPVSAAIARCELTHLSRTPIDPEVAAAEHRAYESALVELGATIVSIPGAPALPDAVFIEDTAVVLDELAILARPAVTLRRLEVAAVAAALSPLRRLEAIEAPGTLDGGDVLLLGRTLFVGRSARTNEAAIEQLGGLVQPFGYEVVEVTLRDCLHLKTAITAVAPDTVLKNPRWLDAAPFSGLQAIDVDPEEPFAANALPLGDGVIHAEHHPRTRERLEKAGIRVVPVPQAELAKAEGGVTCGSILLTGNPAKRPESTP